MGSWAVPVLVWICLFWQQIACACFCDVVLKGVYNEVSIDAIPNPTKIYITASPTYAVWANCSLIFALTFVHL